MKDKQRRLTIPPEVEPPSQSGAPLTTTAHVYGGPGVGLAEIQVSIEPANQAGRGKITAVGIPRIEVQQILSTVLKIPGCVGSLDYSINCRLIGAHKYLPHFGLGLCVAVIGSYFKRPVPDKHVYVGEIDLRRRIRGATKRVVENLRKSVESGEVESGVKVTLPSSLDSEALAKCVAVFSCASLAEVAEATWPQGQ